MTTLGTDSDYGELLADNARLTRDHQALKAEHTELLLKLDEVQRKSPKKSQLVAVGTLVVALANGPAFVELVKEKPPAVTKADVAALTIEIKALREEVASLRNYAREKHTADEKWRRVVGSGLDRLGFRVRGIESDTVKWQSSNAKATAWKAAESDGTELAVDYPLPP